MFEVGKKYKGANEIVTIKKFNLQSDTKYPIEALNENGSQNTFMRDGTFNKVPSILMDLRQLNTDELIAEGLPYDYYTTINSDFTNSVVEADNEASKFASDAILNVISDIRNTTLIDSNKNEPPVSSGISGILLDNDQLVKPNSRAYIKTEEPIEDASSKVPLPLSYISVLPQVVGLFDAIDYNERRAVISFINSYYNYN